MSNARTLLTAALKPALALLPAGMSRDLRPQVLLLAISGQEADWKHRWQIVDAKDPSKKGPARGVLQMEKGGGAVYGILNLGSTRAHVLRLLGLRKVEANTTAIYAAIETDDVLAFGLGRLLLWSDPFALPEVDDVEGMWQVYLRTWRPGAFTNGTPAQREALRRKWDRYYREALAVVRDEGMAS